MNLDYTQLAASFANFLPELALLALFVAALLADALFPSASRRWLGWGVLGGMLVVGGLLCTQVTLLVSHGPVSTWQNAFGAEWLFKGADQPYGFGMMVIDGPALFFKGIVVLTAVLVLFFSIGSERLRAQAGPRMGEYYALIPAMSFGLFLMCGANNLVLMYVAVEITSIAAYVLAGFTRTVPRSSEASMKYVIYGAVASAVMLFGISLLYGLVGTFDFSELGMLLGTPNTENTLSNPLAIASIMILAGLGTKVAAAPFHFWAPDAYEGAPVTVTAFLSVASKGAAFALLIHFIVVIYPSLMQGFNWTPVLGGVAVLTMSLGNLAALQQTNLKRMLAYSSIAHGGYMMAGLATGTPVGVAAIMIYAAVYLVMNLGAFFTVQKIAEAVGSEEIEDFRGLRAGSPTAAVLLTVFMAALIGLPLTGGFIGKLFLFNALLGAGRAYIWLAVVGALNTVVALYYYLRVVRAVIVDPPVAAVPRVWMGRGNMTVLCLLAAAVVLLGLPTFFGPLVRLVNSALTSVLPSLRETASMVGL